MTHNSAHCRGPIDRRSFLKIGGLSLGALSSGLSPDLAGLLAAEAAGEALDKDFSVILFWANGGPSHLDMWDMKPEAPQGIRGEFDPISTSLPEVQFSEYLPRLSRQVHQATLIRSMHHSVNNAHAAAVYAALTGHDRGEIGAAPNRLTIRARGQY